MATEAIAVTIPIPVLIVDDDEAYANFVRAAFSEARGARFDLEHVTRLSQVLPALERRPSSVILLDVNLPDGNGLQWLSANWEQLRGAVLVLTGDTGHATDPDVIAGAQDFLIKSEVDPEHMIRAVRYAADREHARQELLRSRAYFQSLIEQARDLITVVDERGIIRYQSPGTTHMLGLPPESFVGKSLFSLVDQRAGPARRARCSGRLRRQRPHADWRVHARARRRQRAASRGRGLAHRPRGRHAARRPQLA